MSEYNDDNQTMGRQQAGKIVGSVVNSDKGTILGVVHAPKPIVVVYNIFAADLETWLSGLGKDQVTHIAEAGLKKMSVEHASKYAGIAGLATAYTLPHLESVGELNETRKVYVQERHEVLAPLAPLLAANKGEGKSHLFKTGYEGNGVIERALKEVHSQTYHNLAGNATRLIPHLAVNYSTHAKNQIDVLEKQAQTAAESHAQDLENRISHFEKTSHNMDVWGNKAAGAIQTGADELVDNGPLKEKLSGITYGKIMEVGRFMEQSGLNTIKRKGSVDDLEQVTQLVNDAFEQYQTDQGREPIHTRRLRDVSKQVARELVYGDMNWLALFNVIGRDELLIKNDKKNVLVSHDQTEKVLAKERRPLPRLATMDVDQFLSDSNYTLADIKSHLESKDKDERAIVVFLHEDPVLLKAGMKKEEIDESRAYLSKRLTEDAMWKILSNLAKHTDEELQARNFNADDIEALRRYSECRSDFLYALKNPESMEVVKDLARKDLIPEQSDYLKNILAGKGEDGKNGGAKMRDIGAAELDKMPAFTAREEERRKGESDALNPKTPLDHAMRDSGDEAYLG